MGPVEVESFGAAVQVAGFPIVTEAELNSELEFELENLVEFVLEFVSVFGVAIEAEFELVLGLEVLDEVVGAGLVVG